MDTCQEINFPVSMEKTEWAVQIIIFLGILLNAVRLSLQVPDDKRNKAVAQLQQIIEAKKIKVRPLQQLTGLLNFICKAIFPGRAFTRRMYAKYRNLKQHHHIRVDRELRFDCLMWTEFLDNQQMVVHPFVDLAEQLVADEFLFMTDASRNPNLGFGGFIALTQIFGKSEFALRFKGEQYSNRWFHQNWEPHFIKGTNSSIEVCELFAAAIAITIFSKFLANRRVTIFCDNQAVMHMLNKATSSCKKCMFLLRVITGVSLRYNVRFFARFIDTKLNILSDLLSRNKIYRFKRLAPPNTADDPELLPTNLWPIPRYLWEYSSPN